MFSMNHLSLYFPFSIEDAFDGHCYYAMLLGELGQLMHWLMVRKQLDDIFYCYKKKFEDFFGKLEEEKD